MKSSIRSGIGSKTYVDSEDLQKLEYTKQLPTSFCNCIFCQKGEWNSAHIHILFDKLRKYSYTVGQPLDGVYQYALLPLWCKKRRDYIFHSRDYSPCVLKVPVSMGYTLR